MQLLRMLPIGQPRDAVLRRSLLLAGLLHVWLVLIFGTYAGGTAPPGQGVWGSLQVRLQSLTPGGGGAVPDAAQPKHRVELAEGPRGRAASPRSGGAVRDKVPAQLSEGPGAARIGHWQPTAGDAPLEKIDVAPAQQHDLAPLPEAPTMSPAPTLQARSPTGIERPQASALAPLGTVGATALQTPVPGALPEAPPMPVVQTIKSMQAAPSSVTRMVASTPTRIGAARQLDAPIKAPAAPRRPEPGLSRLNTDTTTLSGAPAVTADALRPRIEPSPVPSQAAPTPSPNAAREPKVEALADAQAPASQSAPKPASAPWAEPTTAKSAELVPATSQAAASAPQVPVQPVVPSLDPSVSPAQSTPTSVAAPSATQAVASPQAPSVVPSGSQAKIQLNGAGSPDAGSRLGHDVATPASVPPERPRLNLALPQQMRPGALAQHEAKGVLNLVPPPPERKSKLAQDLEKSVKKDCRTAYGGAGLLAVVPLAVNALRDEKDCKW